MSKRAKMMRFREICLTVALALYASVSFAGAIPLEREAWECVNPLGGDFTNGTYVSMHSAAQGFEIAKGVPVSSNAVVEAAFTPGRADGTGFKTAGVSLYETNGRFWHLALVESPAKYRYFELSEMRDGRWLAHKDLKVEINEKHGQWKTGEKYRLRLEMDGKGVEGTVCGEDGRLVFRCRFALKPGAVGCGRPAIKCHSLAGVFLWVRVEHGAAVATERDHPAVIAVATERDPPTAFYRTIRDGEGRWWFVDPDGKRFFLNGIGMVNHAGHHSAALGYAPYARAVQRKYPTLEDWATNTLARLKSWGFNMLSSSASELLRRGMPHADVLAMGQSFSECGDEFDILPGDGGPCAGFPNVFHPKWEAYCRFVARKCAANRNDRWVLGWYIDNELAWWGDRRKFRASPSRGLFDACARKSQGRHTARRALDAFLKERGLSSPEATAEDATREFIRLVARRYFETAARAIREADPNHLVLGCRFAGLPTSDPVVWEECGRFCDVVSVNTYPLVDLDRGIALNGLDKKARPIADEIAERAALAGKPLIVTEWSFVALDSGLPCLHGAGQRFFTQKERAEATSILSRTLYALPGCAGYVYFMWSDLPKVGKHGERSENCNYGLVDANDDPWPEQVAALSEVQNNPAKWRCSPLPPDRPVVKPTASAVARAAVCRNAQCRFKRGEDGAFELSNGLVSLAGRMGGENVSVDGTGMFSPSIREYARGSMWWSSAPEVVDVRGGVKDGLGVMEVTFRGKTATGAFEMVEKFYLPEGSPFFLVEVCRIVNRGERALPVDMAFFRLVPRDRDGVKVAKGDDALEPPKEDQPTPIPPQLWRPWRAAAWELPDGTCLGLVTPHRTGVDITFWKDKNLHPDACVRLSRTEIAPSGSFEVPDHPFVAGACCPSGADAWHRVCAAFRECVR
ncbi:MAG: hypothetical protein IKF72_02785 [Kiritimatiellae bacterium]|nr:hypothetical protein [Kiritimatiellia bacterium]